MYLCVFVTFLIMEVKQRESSPVSFTSQEGEETNNWLYALLDAVDIERQVVLVHGTVWPLRKRYRVVEMATE